MIIQSNKTAIRQSKTDVHTDLVCFKTLSLCGQSNIHKVLLLQNMLERRRQRNLIIVPLQAELLPHLVIFHVLVVLDFFYLFMFFKTFIKYNYSLLYYNDERQSVCLSSGRKLRGYCERQNFGCRRHYCYIQRRYRGGEEGSTKGVLSYNTTKNNII